MNSLPLKKLKMLPKLITKNKKNTKLKNKSPEPEFKLENNEKSNNLLIDCYK